MMTGRGGRSLGVSDASTGHGARADFREIENFFLVPPRGGSVMTDTEKDKR